VSDSTPGEDRQPAAPGHTRILIGLVAGALLGLAANWLARQPAAGGAANPLDVDGNAIDDRLDWVAQNIADPIGRIFLRLVFMVVLPLVFSALALAVVEIGDLRRLGKFGLRTLLFTAILSLTAVGLGIGLVNLVGPGRSLPEERRDELQSKYASKAADTVGHAARAKPLRDMLVDIIPENPLQEMVGAIDGRSSPGNGMLAVMFFALVVGAAAAAAPERCATLVGWLEGLNSVAMTVIGWAMRLAPAGAGCLVFSVTARIGFDIVVTLFWFVVTVFSGLAIHLLVVYPIVLIAFSRKSPREFFRGAWPAMLMAFGTSSSSATLPTALRVAETRLGLPRDISRFVLTVGATGNQNGTALYEGVVVLFLAQVFGVELSLADQVRVVLMSVLAGIGTAGVPGGSLPLIVVLLRSVGIPGEGIGIILGIDRLLDMGRTVLNVTGDLAIAACVGGAARDTEAPRKPA
jgi:DAACS family dicarboxylate/amino acid:cation (Na+ or H+) symporter